MLPERVLPLVVSLNPHSGTFDAKFVSDAGGWSHCTKSLEPSPVIYARAYYKFSTLNLGSWDVLSLLRLSHGNYNNSVTAQILFHDGNYYWQLATSDGVNNYHDQSVSSNITTGVWHCIEIKRDVINGQEELWVDGVSKVSAAHNIMGNTDRLEVGITYCGNVLGSGNTCYVDDVVITGAYNALGGPKTLSPPGLGTLTTPSITMSTYHTVKLRSTSQFYLTVNSTYSVAGGMGWYDSGSTAHATLMNGTVYGGTGIQLRLHELGWRRFRLRPKQHRYHDECRENSDCKLEATVYRGSNRRNIGLNFNHRLKLNRDRTNLQLNEQNTKFHCQWCFGNNRLRKRNHREVTDRRHKWSNGLRRWCPDKLQFCFRRRLLAATIYV